MYGFANKGPAAKLAQQLNSLEKGLYWRVSRYTLDGICICLNINKPVSYIDVVESQLFGWIQARMYAGAWNSEEFQNFSLKGIAKSWLHSLRRNSTRKLNFANSTSFAAHDLVGLMRISIRKELWKCLLLDGQMSVEHYQKLRTSVGLDPIRQSTLDKWFKAPTNNKAEVKVHTTPDGWKCLTSEEQPDRRIFINPEGTFIRSMEGDSKVEIHAGAPKADFD
jgi:hypothetical protein